jgi:hypothetical protein
MGTWELGSQKLHVEPFFFYFGGLYISPISPARIHTKRFMFFNEMSGQAARSRADSCPSPKLPKQSLGSRAASSCASLSSSSTSSAVRTKTHMDHTTHKTINYVSPKPSTPVHTLHFLTLAGSKLPRFIRHACLDPICGVCR